MPVFTASTVPSVVGLYIDKFIDPAGQLSALLVTSGGTGYTTNNPPQIVVVGGGGSGAVIEPVILNGQLIGVDFYRDPNLGDLRGSNYTSIPTFYITGGTGTGATMTCNLSQNTTILGNSTNENSLLQFCYDHCINYIALYNMRLVNWASNTSTNLSNPGKNLLANFIQKAKNSGVTEVGAITSGSQTDVNNIISYQDSRTGSTQRFDWLNLEKEYWNGDGTFTDYVTRLTYMKQQATGATYPMGVEIYLGWPSYSEMIQLIPQIDRLLLHDYSSKPVPNYDYTQSRLIEKIGSACTFLSTTLDIMPIFSAERIYSPWNADYEFMGIYYTNHTIYDAWYGWAYEPNGYVYNNSNLGSYNSESSPFVRDNLNPVGHIIFDQSLLRASNPPTLPSFVSYITSDSPTSGVTSGNTITLSANPIGYSYYWYPNGETTRDISVTDEGSYYVKVTNFSGKTSTSTAVTVSFLTGGTCIPTISYNGSTDFLSGGTLTLSASSGSTYYWYPNGQTTQNITVSGSGNYYVAVDTGTGCTGSSQFVSVNVSPCATSIYPTGPISAITGTSILLSSTTTGTTYTWYPNLETGNTISVTSDGSYSVVVDNGNGCIATASTVDVYFFSCISTISYTGSTTINSGQTINLCANSADSYLWYPNGETTQCINVGTGGTYYVETQYVSGCTATSQSVTINVLTGTCSASISASGPLYYSSGISINSVTLSASSGTSYYWYPSGETTQTIVVSGSGIYTVDVNDGFGCTATSSIVVTANNWNPINGFWTEDNFPARLNSNLSYTPAQIDYPWIEYKINLTNTTTKKYYSFFKFRSINGRKTGLRFAVNNIANFIPITGIKDTTMGWYRIEVSNNGLTQLLNSQINTFYIQMNNFNCEIEQFAISENPDFVPGPYPNYSYV